MEKFKNDFSEIYLLIAVVGSVCVILTIGVYLATRPTHLVPRRITQSEIIFMDVATENFPRRFVIDPLAQQQFIDIIESHYGVRSSQAPRTHMTGKWIWISFNIDAGGGPWHIHSQAEAIAVVDNTIRTVVSPEAFNKEIAAWFESLSPDQLRDPEYGF
ncbi:MAG: hypothetical protein FWD96_06690 [Defluviitaleaceae bacterium]|nr:hypothetical protein [Defluviitaleaceae bacterium]